MEHCPPWRALRQTALSPSAGPKNERSCHCLYSYLTLFGPQPYLALWGSGADWGCFSEERPRMEHGPPFESPEANCTLAKHRPKERAQLPLLVPLPYPVWPSVVSCSMGLRGGLGLILPRRGPAWNTVHPREP